MDAIKVKGLNTLYQELQSQAKSIKDITVYPIKFDQTSKLSYQVIVTVISKQSKQLKFETLTNESYFSSDYTLENYLYSAIK